jgi:hypothetical protein
LARRNSSCRSRHQQRHTDLRLVDGQRARHDDPPLACEVGPPPARQDGLARADDGGQRDESSAHDRRPDVALHLGTMLGLEEAGIDWRALQAVECGL